MPAVSWPDPSADERAGSWRQLAKDGEAPSEPVDSYQLWVAEKSVRPDGAIRFDCVAYRWQLGKWVRAVADPFVQADPRLESALPAETWEAGTDVGTIAEAWADYSHAVSMLNEPAYSAWLDTQKADDARRLQEQQAEQDRLNQLVQSQQLVAMLPGRDAPVEPHTGDLPDPFVPELNPPPTPVRSEAEQIVRFFESRRILDHKSKQARGR